MAVRAGIGGSNRGGDTTTGQHADRADLRPSCIKVGRKLCAFDDRTRTTNVAGWLLFAPLIESRRCGAIRSRPCRSMILAGRSSEEMASAIRLARDDFRRCVFRSSGSRRTCSILCGGLSEILTLCFEIIDLVAVTSQLQVADNVDATFARRSENVAGIAPVCS